MTIKKNTYYLILIAFIFTSCATYSIQTNNLVEQLKEKQKIAPNDYFQKFSLIDYPSNNLDRINAKTRTEIIYGCSLTKTLNLYLSPNQLEKK